MNVGIFLGHPAHFHYYKNMAIQLQTHGINVLFAVKEKDILEQLMIEAGFSYIKVRGKRNNSSKWNLLKSAIEIDYKLGRFVKEYKVDILIGAAIPYSSRWYNAIPISIGEDDARVVPMYSLLAFPGMSEIITPIVCNNWFWESKCIKYPSNLELAYLHPNHFIADKAVVEGYGIDTSKPYFILRFASLNAHHDDGICGINTEIAQRLIDILSPHGQIYITSERELEPQFEPYRIRINPLDMHHVMAFASLYIGDSQTMAAEAGVLGTPFVRFNDFVGRIGYLRELEDVYQLGYGIHATRLTEESAIRRNDGSLQPSGVEALYDVVNTLVAMPAEERRALYAERRKKMLCEKIDTSKFLTWFIENYPDSQRQTRDNQQNNAFWAQFK